jgi:hypothetical protein
MSLSASFSACAFGPKKRPPQPEREYCLIGDAGCVCWDPRFDEPPPDTFPISCERAVGEKREGSCYVRPFPQCRNYHAYSPQDYNASQEWIRAQCYGPRDVTPAR